MNNVLAEVEEREKKRLIGGFMAMRLAIVPIPAGLMTWLIVSDHTLWRRVILACGMALMISVAVSESLRFRRQGLGVRTINLVLAMTMQNILIFITGGVESPVLPTLLISSAGLAMFSKRELRPLMFCLATVGIWVATIAALRGWVPDFNPTVFGGGVRSGHNDVHLIFSSLVITIFMAIMLIAGDGLRQSYNRLIGGLIEAREDALTAHAEKAQLLETLSGEIAHELKNPLASVKGLGALIAKDLSGKSAERMGVLRREVDRMHEILDQFLNFSRPVGALAQEEIDLAALSTQVAALHEGMAAEKRIHLRVDGAARARCDRRKVQQVLINLVQNAIEASAADGEVAIEVRQNAAAAVEVAVLNRGVGLTIERAFEPGVTSKPKGSGLGLTIARALARQHGGDVRLVSRAGGGVEAVLALPIAEKAA